MAAKRYAKALLEVMLKEGLTAPVREDMRMIREAMKKKEARDFFADRAVSKKDKMEPFRGCQPVTKSFLGVVIDNKREKELYGISREFMDMLNRELNEEEVEVRSARALAPATKAALKEKLEKKLMKKANISFRINRKIIGGLYIRYGSNVIDGTVNRRLEDMKRSLTGT